MAETDRLQQARLTGQEPEPATKALVLVDEAPDLELWYLVPPQLIEQAQLGCRVSVPLRSRQVSGTIIHTCLVEAETYKLRAIGRLLHPEPLIPALLLELAHWIADYYACRLETVVRGMIPESIRTGSSGFKTQKAVVLKKEPSGEELATLQKRAKRQAAILQSLEPGKPVLVTKFTEAFSSAGAAIQRLEELGWVEIQDQVLNRDPTATEEFLPSTPLDLNDEQTEALEVILSEMEANRVPQPILLKGVTGSGKTEVYMQAISAAIEKGQNVIVLVPEIALTPQTTERFKRRFADMQHQVAILHSHLSDGERHDEWRKILDGDARIVIGARSAVFAPLRNVGLIIVDEEHENSYKQENPPRYQGRDIAVVRAKLERAALVLGSATPSLESFVNAQTGKYRLVELTKRADEQKLPLTRVVDMRVDGNSGRAKGTPAILSEKLRLAIQNRLDRGEQTILFLNRRGFSPSVLCQDCGR